MNLLRKYDRNLRRKYSFRAVWLPGIDIKVGDILRLKDGALISVGNIAGQGIPFVEEQIADMDALDIKAAGVSKSILQNGTTVGLDKLNSSGEFELNIKFNAEHSYLLKTPKLTGVGLASALDIAREVARLSTWDYRNNYIVHQVYTAEDFVFLGSTAKGSTLSFKGSGEAIRNFINGGSSAGLERTGSRNLSIEVTDKAGPVVMRLIRIKRNGEIF